MDIDYPPDNFFCDRCRKVTLHLRETDDRVDAGSVTRRLMGRVPSLFICKECGEPVALLYDNNGVARLLNVSEFEHVFERDSKSAIK